MLDSWGSTFDDLFYTRGLDHAKRALKYMLVKKHLTVAISVVMSAATGISGSIYNWLISSWFMNV